MDLQRHDPVLTIFDGLRSHESEDGMVSVSKRPWVTELSYNGRYLIFMGSTVAGRPTLDTYRTTSNHSEESLSKPEGRKYFPILRNCDLSSDKMIHGCGHEEHQPIIEFPPQS